MDVQVAVAGAVTALVALTHQTHRVSVVDTRGNLHRQRGAAAHLRVTATQHAHRASAVALDAGIRVDVARAAAARTGRHRHHDTAVILCVTRFLQHTHRSCPCHRSWDMAVSCCWDPAHESRHTPLTKPLP